MKIQRGMVFETPDSQPDSQQTNQSESNHYTIQHFEKKEYDNSKGPQSHTAQTLNNASQAITKDPNTRQGQISPQQIPSSQDQQRTDQPKKPDEGYTEGLKEEIQEHTEEGQKDISEMAKLEGTELAVRETVSEVNKQKEKLDDLVNNANKVLMKFSTVFPFDLFPDEISIDPVKVSVISKDFFKSGQIRNISLKDITDVLVETSPFLCTLKIINNKDKEPLAIKPLHRDDAIQAGSILHGLLMTQKQNIDITKIPVEESVEKIEELGHISSTANSI